MESAVNAELRPVTHIFVDGQVQGVGYRHFVLRLAESLGLHGEVWNRDEGGVEIVAAAPSPEIETTFVHSLWNGPGQTQNVEVHHGSVERIAPHFVIGPTR
jgi:acylphosphatase